MENLPSPKEYAQKLIDSHLVVNQGKITSKLHAITDVENTIKFCTETVGKHFELTPEFDYLNEVLYALKQKL